MFSTLFASLLFAVPLPELPRAEPPKEATPECKIQRSYIGAILDHEVTLTIDGPDKKTWKYEFNDRNVTLSAPVKWSKTGTYEVEGDLAIFTELKDGKPDTKFALNFRRDGKEVVFDAYFPQKDGRMRYARRWYEKHKEGFRLVEAVSITFPTPDPKKLGKEWQIHYQGEHVIADADGTLKKMEVDHREPYVQQAPNYYTRIGLTASPSWMTPEMLVTVRDGVVIRVQRGHPTINDANGFHPGMAERRMK